MGSDRRRQQEEDPGAEVRLHYWAAVWDLVVHCGTAMSLIFQPVSMMAYFCFSAQSLRCQLQPLFETYIQGTGVTSILGLVIIVAKVMVGGKPPSTEPSYTNAHGIQQCGVPEEQQPGPDRTEVALPLVPRATAAVAPEAGFRYRRFSVFPTRQVRTGPSSKVSTLLRQASRVARQRRGGSRRESAPRDAALGPGNSWHCFTHLAFSCLFGLHLIWMLIGVTCLTSLYSQLFGGDWDRREWIKEEDCNLRMVWVTMVTVGSQVVLALIAAAWLASNGKRYARSISGLHLSELDKGDVIFDVPEDDAG